MALVLRVYSPNTRVVKPEALPPFSLNPHNIILSELSLRVFTFKYVRVLRVIMLTNALISILIGDNLKLSIFIEIYNRRL